MREMLSAYNLSSLSVLLSETVVDGGTHVIVVENNLQIRQVALEIQALLPKHKDWVISFPDLETLPYDFVTPHPSLIAARMQGLYHLLHKKNHILITSITGWTQLLPPREFILKNTLLLCVGEKMTPASFREIMYQKGYALVREVHEHGEFSVRGSILDIYPSMSKKAYRIELFDDEIDNIRLLDVESLRSNKHINQITLLPAQQYTLDPREKSQREEKVSCLISKEDSLIKKIINGSRFAGIDAYLPCLHKNLDSLEDYLSEKAICYIPEQFKILQEKHQSFIQNRYEMLKLKGMSLVEPQRLYRLIENDTTISKHISYQLNRTDGRFSPLEYIEETNRSKWIERHIHNNEARSYSTRFTTLTKKRHSNLISYFVEHSIPMQSSQKIVLEPLALREGFIDNQLHTAWITEADILGRDISQDENKTTKKTTHIIDNWEVGALLVHRDYGIGKFQAFENVCHQNKPQDYLVMIFKDEDKLFVSTQNIHLLSLYRGKTNSQVELDKLGSKKWQQKKQQAKRVAEDFAEKLLTQHTQRKSNKAPKISIDTFEYTQFCSGFAFETTPDQQKTIDVVLEDIQQSKGMDRLICGDVGFGKTEVALRAAFCCMMNGFQVALLCPTTILCEQHLRTFTERMQNWPLRIEALSRLQSSKQKEHVQALTEGKIDCIIATHALLSPNIQFHKLGLLIVDEEHKFGVKQKELLQALRGHAHILSLSATPIPRTLNMAMANIRDMSIIATPPKNRTAVATHIQNYDSNTIIEALMREKQRGGQAYYMHNDIKSLPSIEEKIHKLCPDISTKIISGKTNKKELDKTMLAFSKQQFDVLIATSIIESGIDIPNANTIIIHRADLLGLSQIHQLRGRVGRSQHQAFAYFFIPPEHCLTAEGKSRIATIRKQSELGSGLNIALEDLEIRGAGDILGKKQSGHMAEVGLTLYTEMLQKAIRKNNGIATVDHTEETEIESTIDITIPEKMIVDIEEKLNIYRAIRLSTNEKDLSNIRKDLEDKYGVLPRSVENLLIQRQIQMYLTIQGVKKLQIRQTSIACLLNEKNKINIMDWIQHAQKHFEVRCQVDNKLNFHPKDSNYLKDYKKVRDLFIY